LAAAGRTLARKGGCGSPKPKKVCVHGGWGEVPKVGAGLVGEELGAWRAARRRGGTPASVGEDGGAGGGRCGA
jgi:hypothetical protein